MKKVLLIETFAQVNGGQKMSLLIADMLRESGKFDVIWAIPTEGGLSDVLQSKGYTYELLGDLNLPSGVKGKSVIFTYGLMTLRSIRKINRMIRTRKIDIVYAPGPAALPWAAFCGLLRHKAVIWHLHHIFMDGPTKKLLNYCSAFSSVKRIIAVSNAVAEQITDKTGKTKCLTLYNPVDFQKYSSGKIENIAATEPFMRKLGGEKLMVLEHIGIIHPTKNQEFTIRLVGAFRKMDRQVHAVFIGKCESTEDDYQQELMALSEQLGISDRIHFVGLQSNIPDWLKGADAVVVPSLEGLPLVALEAMAAGVPIIATDQCGVGELLHISEVGRTFAENEPLEDICQLTLAAIEDKNRIRNGLAFAEMHDYRRYSDSLIQVFDC